MHFQFIHLLQHPAHGAVPRADQHSERSEVPEQPEAEPRTGSAQFEHLSRVEELTEPTQELDALVVACLKRQMFKTCLF